MGRENPKLKQTNNNKKDQNIFQMNTIPILKGEKKGKADRSK